jgi:hypothetical protein
MRGRGSSRNIGGMRARPQTRRLVALALALAGLAAWALVTADDSRAPAPAGRQAPPQLPAAARGPLSAALGRASSGYRVVGLRAHNPAHRLATTFSRTGVTIASGPARVRLALDAYGHAGAMRRVRGARPRVAANRVVYRRDGIDEWYANGPLGLEQGFDLRSRPPGHGPLSLSLALSGDSLARRGGSSALLDGAGGRLSYGGLTTTDARGRSLRTWVDSRAGHLVIRADDRDADYPLRIDPFIQQAELAGNDTAAGDLFGVDFALDGDTLVVSAPGHKSGAGGQVGALYVFQRPASGWANARQTAKLTASDAVGDNLGTVGISGDTIVAGDATHKVGDNDQQGAVYVFVEPASGWRDATETAKLTADDGVANNFLGNEVAVSGDTIAATAPGRKVGSHESQGVIYVFVKPASGWKDGNEIAQLTTTDGADREVVGTLAMSGDTIVLGSANHKVGDNERQGVAYVFEKPPGGWANVGEIARLTASDGAAQDQFGAAVAVSGDTVVVGAGAHGVGSHGRQGAVYVYVKTVFGWVSGTQTAELTAADGATNDLFGISVAISGDRIVTGAALHQVGATPGTGAAYVFDKPGPAWTDMTRTAEPSAANGASGDAFGLASAVSGNVVFVGAPFRNGARGAAYVFGVPPEIAIGAPGNRTVYRQGQRVVASYSCAAPAGATITSCTGPVAAGARIDTAAPGPHSFAVSAVDTDGLTATRSVSYTVLRQGPSITRLKQAARVWRRGDRLARVARKRGRPVGTTFSFRLSERARLTFIFTRRAPGRKGTSRLRLQGRQGANRVRFQGRLSRARRLPPGRYTVRIVATGATGARTTSRPLNFTIVR